MASGNFEEFMASMKMSVYDWDPAPLTHPREPLPVPEDHDSATACVNDNEPHHSRSPASTINDNSFNLPSRSFGQQHTKDELFNSSDRGAATEQTTDDQYEDERSYSDTELPQSSNPSQPTVDGASSPGTPRAITGRVSGSSPDLPPTQAVIQRLESQIMNPDGMAESSYRSPYQPVPQTSSTTTPRVPKSPTERNFREEGSRTSLGYSPSLGSRSMTPVSVYQTADQPQTQRSRSSPGISTADNNGRRRYTRSRRTPPLKPVISYDNTTKNIGSFPSSTSARRKRCILEDHATARMLLDLVRQGLDGSQDGGQDERVRRINLMDDIQSFYGTHAYGPVEKKPSDGSVRKILVEYWRQVVEDKEEMVVHEVDKLYVAAGWQLGGQTAEEVRSESRIQDDSLAAMSYSATVPNSRAIPIPTAIPYSVEPAYSTARPNLTELAPQRTSARRGSDSQIFTEPLKRQKERSPTGTSPSTKRSRPDSTHTAPSTASESRTSFSQSQRNREIPCYCGERTFSEFKGWIKHDNKHNPVYFYACLSENCKYITLRQDSMVAHWKTTHRKEDFTHELRRRQNANRFWIFDRGHERCIYKNCNAVFNGNGISSREHITEKHIIPHINTINPAQDLSVEHRCTDNKCGKDNHWKSSVYVTGRRHPYNGGTGSVSYSFGDEDEQERESIGSRVSIRQGSVGRETMNTRIERENMFRTFNNPHPPLMATRNDQAAANIPIQTFMDDNVTYAVEPHRILTRPSAEEAARCFRQDRLPADIPLPISTLGSNQLEETQRAIETTDSYDLVSTKDKHDTQHIPLQTDIEKQTISVLEEPQNTVEASIENSTAYPLTGVGTHSMQFEIPLSANLDDDLTNDIHNDKLVLENEAVE